MDLKSNSSNCIKNLYSKSYKRQYKLSEYSRYDCLKYQSIFEEKITHTSNTYYFGIIGIEYSTYDDTYYLNDHTYCTTFDDNDLSLSKMTYLIFNHKNMIIKRYIGFYTN